MAADNATILAKVWLNGTNDFQQRIPDPTQHGVDATMQALFDPMNRQYYNQFIDSLVMRIGYTYVHQQAFSNPLGIFKKKKLMYGDSVQEMVPKWIRAHSYVDDAEDVFKMARPDVATWYHSQNRRDRYDITINDTELRTAFTDSYGLNKLVSAFMNTPTNADEYDEYRIMLQLLAFYANNWGFYQHHLSAAPTNEATGKEFLTAVRAYAGKLQFPSTVYNCKAIEDVPVFVKPTELVLLLTPDVQANIDVNTLASVFQLDKADIKYRTVIVDEFPMPNDVAVLTTEDFFQCYDTVYETTSMYNPKTLGTNYYLHHWGVYSVSPFVPAIAFTTDAATSVTTVKQTVTGITAKIANATPDLGESTAITTTLNGTLAPTGTRGIEVAPNAATYDVSVSRVSGSNTVPINSPATRVDEYGVLHVSNKLQYGDVIKVNIGSTYTNPSGATTAYATSVTATVTKPSA